MKLAREITIGGKSVSVPVNVIDDLVNFFDPARGQVRYQNRVRMALVGGYTGADRTRRANQSGRIRERDADTAILPALPALREESQHLFRNNQGGRYRPEGQGPDRPGRAESHPRAGRSLAGKGRA